MKEFQPFYRFTAETGDEPTSAELMIFDAIGNWDEMGEVSAKAFAKDLAKLPSSVKRLDIHINSPGGSVYDAQGIYSRLADHRADKHVYIDGLCASAASIVAMVGHKVYIRGNATMMIHLPSAITMGNEDDHQRSINALRSITDGMINAYAKKTKLDRAELRDMLAAETWFNADQAVEKGFADEVRGVIKAAATFDLKQFNFRNIPPALNATAEKPKPMAKPKAANEQDENNNKDEDESKETPTPPQKETSTPDTPPPPPPPPPATAAATEFDKGVKAERDRIIALQALDRPATHAIVEAAIKDGKQPSDIIAECMTAMDNASKQSARRVDASNLNDIPPADGADEDNNNFGAILKKKVKARLRARGQVSTLQSRN
jgi:ATP-dependent protease ClpP protease subunit